MYRTSQHRGADLGAAWPSKRSTRFRWSDSETLVWGGQKTGLVHTQWLEQPTLHELIERLTADALHNLREDDEVDVAVDNPCAGRVNRPFLDRKGDGSRRTLELLFERKASPQTRRVCKKMLDRDPILAVAIEPRDVARHGVSQPDPSIFNEHHHRWSRCHYLRQRG